MGDIWNDPVQTETEGVIEANPPATPSEVVIEPSLETETAAEALDESLKDAEQAKEQAAPEAQSETSSDPPDVKREARRVFMETQKLGGFESLKEAHEFQTAIQDQSLDAKAKLDHLYRAAPRAFEDLKKELFYSYWDNPAQQDALDQERYGATAAEIKEALAARGQIAPSPTPQQTQPVSVPTLEELNSMDNEDIAQRFKDLQAQAPKEIPDEVKAKLQRLDELEKEFPQLKSQVSSFAEQQKEARAKQVTELGGEFVQEAISPVVRMMEEAGLKVLPDDTPEEKAWKEEVWDTILTKSYQKVIGEPVADDVQTFLEKLDRPAAWAKMRLVQAKAEMAAAKLIPIYTSHRQQQRESQTSVLGKDRPPVITGGQTSLGSPQPLATGRSVWDDPNEQERWKDIAAQTA